jgi:hypothetical protein
MGHRQGEIKARSGQWRLHKRWGREAFGFFDPTGPPQQEIIVLDGLSGTTGAAGPDPDPVQVVCAGRLCTRLMAWLKAGKRTRAAAIRSKTSDTGRVTKMLKLPCDRMFECPAGCPPFETAFVPMARLSRECTDASAAANHRVAAFAYGPATSRRPRRLTMGQTAKVACRRPWTSGLV